MLLVLAWAAGIMDAVAYLGLGVFTTLMTGNTALLAFAIARGELMPIVRAGLALAAFSAGAARGALVGEGARSRGEWPSVVTEALAGEGIRCLGVPGVSTTYITSALTNLSAELVGWTRSRDGGREQRVRLLAAVFITYGLGALVGAARSPWAAVSAR